MKRIIAFILILILILPNCIKAKEFNLSPKELVDMANKEIINLGLFGEEYFSKDFNIAGKPLSENEHLRGYRNYIVY